MRDLNDTAPPSDELLMAWVDGELDASTHAAVQARLDADPQARERVARLQALTHQLRVTFADELNEPAPASLLAAAQGAARPSARVLPWPAPGNIAGWTGWARWGGLAAGVALVLAMAPALWPFGAADERLLAQADGRLVARGALAQRLETGLASAPEPGAVRVLLSFKDRDGRFCRTFASPAGTGLACRDAGQWQVAVLAAGAAGDTPALRLAGSDLPATVLEAVERRIAGLALDAAQERAARDAGWRP